MKNIYQWNALFLLLYNMLPSDMKWKMHNTPLALGPLYVILNNSFAKWYTRYIKRISVFLISLDNEEKNTDTGLLKIY